jgi:Transcriptional regulators
MNTIYNVVEESGQPVGRQASQKIVKYIVDKNIKVGEKIPSEYELVDILNVGRSTVREAIRALSSRNILEIKRGVGTFVKCKDGAPDDPLGFAFVEDKLKLTHDLLEIRSMMEPKIAQMAAINATPKQIEEIQKLAEEIENFIKIGQHHEEKDLEFHTAIANSCGNIAMSKLIPIINESIELSVEIINEELKKETILVHKEIVEAIKERNGDRAYDAMVLHMLYNKRHIRQIVDGKIMNK